MRRWTKIGAGLAASVTTILGLFFLLQSNFGFIITDQTGNFSCEGSYENPCISEFTVRNPTRYDVDIFNQDEIQLDFSPNIEDYALFTKDGRCSATGSCACTLNDGQRIGFKGWRCIDFTSETKPRKDKVYVFRFPKYSTKEFRLVGIKNNPNDVVKWGFGANNEYLDPVWDAKETYYERTPTTETFKNSDGTFTKTLYSGVRFVEEDDTWKKVEDARSLKGSQIKCVVTKGKDDPEVECLDYNYTTIKIEVKDKKSYPIKIYYKNNTLKSQKAEKNLDIETIEIDFGDELHIGEHSTVVSLEVNQSGLSVSYNDELTPTKFGSQWKWDISGTLGEELVSATFCGNILAVAGTIDNTTTVWRMDNQSWEFGTTNASQLDSMAKTNEENVTLSSITLETWSCFNATNLVQVDYDSNNENTTIRMEDNNFIIDSIASFATCNYNIGQLNPNNLFVYDCYNSANPPYLNITYSPSTATTCNYPGSGNWVIDCSDNCFINSSISIDGNLSLQGSGTVRINSTLDFNSTGQIMYQGSGCSFVVNSGGKIS